MEASNPLRHLSLVFLILTSAQRKLAGHVLSLQLVQREAAVCFSRTDVTSAWGNPYLHAHITRTHIFTPKASGLGWDWLWEIALGYTTLSMPARSLLTIRNLLMWGGQWVMYGWCLCYLQTGKLVVLFCFVLFLIWPSHVACGILAPGPRVKPASLELKTEHLNHWTARAVPSVGFKEGEFLGTLWSSQNIKL